MFDFFPRGALPDGYRLEIFLKAVSELRPRDEIYLAKAIAGLSPSRLTDFASRVISVVTDERLLRNFFQNPGVHRKMDIDAISLYFTVVCSMEHRGLISKDFFEEMATSLVKGFASWGSVLSRIGEAAATATRGKYPIQHFISPHFDQALAWHIAAYDVSNQGPRNASRSWDSLKAIELPQTLETYLLAIQDAKPEAAFQLVGDLVSSDKLSDSYIAVVRRVIGDDQLVRVANHFKEERQGIKSIAKLSRIFGEAVFHHEEFLDDLHDRQESGLIPEYLSKFQAMGFDELTFPLLAGFLVDNLSVGLGFDPDRVDMRYAVELSGLAARSGHGDQALRAHLIAVAGAIGLTGMTDPSWIVNGACLLSKSNQQSTIHLQAHSNILNVLAKVGLESLSRVAPDVKAEVVMDFLEKRPSSLSKREVMKLFPQTKRIILENDLGL